MSVLGKHERGNNKDNDLPPRKKQRVNNIENNNNKDDEKPDILSEEHIQSELLKVQKKYGFDATITQASDVQPEQRVLSLVFLSVYI